MPEAYLTIDDGPSEKFTALVDFLHARKIPAVFFNRGDNMEARPDAVIYGIERGYIMANHTYSHGRAEKLSAEETFAEIERTEEILEKFYARAGVKRPGKYFRFPYMDRGMGPYFVEPENLDRNHEDAQKELLGSGLGHIPAIPGMCAIDKKRRIQKFLKDTGYTNLPVEGVTIPWYAQTEMAGAIDSLCTFSTSDWALLERHKGRHGFSTLDDLKTKIDTDKWLKDQASRHIVLAHDQAEIHSVVKSLVEHMTSRGITFIDLKS